jgi:hypothetical protein
MVTLKPGGRSGGSPVLHASHGMPAPPQFHASSRSRNISNGRSEWFSQTQPVLSQTGQGCSPVPLLNREALGLFRVELELRNGLGRLCVGCLDIAKVLSAGAENCDPPPPELSGGGPFLGRSDFFLRDGDMSNR